MKLFITSLKRITSTQPEELWVTVGYSKATDDGYTSAEFEVEISNVDFMSMSLNEIESLAISRAMQIIS